MLLTEAVLFLMRREDWKKRIPLMLGYCPIPTNTTMPYLLEISCRQGVKKNGRGFPDGILARLPME